MSVVQAQLLQVVAEPTRMLVVEVAAQVARVLNQVERYGVPALEWFLRETQRLTKRVPA